MKRSVSDLGMAKKMRKAFTLIEVMVSVMIITVVVMALYAMNGNTSFIYEKSVHAMPVNQYLSFFTSHAQYGFESEEGTLENLLEGFDVEDELRRELKAQKVKILYSEVRRIDMSEFGAEEMQEALGEQEEPIQKEQGGNSSVFELGKTSLILEENSGYILRLRVL